MAPAITLNRMYHCVPSSIRRMEPTPNPPPRRTSPSSTTGNSAVAGTEAAICVSGWATPPDAGWSRWRHRREWSMSRRGSEQPTRRKWRPRPDRVCIQRPEPCRCRGPGPEEPHTQQTPATARGRYSRRTPTLRLRPGRPACSGGARQAASHAGSRGFDNQREASEFRSRSRMAKWRLDALHLFEIELLRPRDSRPPYQLVDQHDHPDHGAERPTGCTVSPGARRGLQIGAQARQAKIAFAQHEHLAGHKKKPAARLPKRWNSRSGRWCQRAAPAEKNAATG